MHREIMCPSPEMAVDHKNHNTLDNRKSNLRVCSYTENLRNRKRSKNKKSSQYKGVYPGYKGAWTATIQEQYIGTFDTELEAAKAYDHHAERLFGDFACKNIL